jgi:hypothetical protein
MIVLFGILVVAAVLISRRREDPRGRGWPWFGAWLVGGALFTFSWVAGLSIGLLVLPFAAAAVLFVAFRAPHLHEAVGFAAGAGGILLLVAVLNRGSGDLDATPWLVAGLTLALGAVAAYSVSGRGPH